VDCHPGEFIAIRPQTADFTRLQEPPSPTNPNRTSKRQKELNVNPPPCLDLDGSARTCNTASKAVSGQFEALEREARIQHTIIYDLATIVDQFVSAHRTHATKSFATLRTSYLPNLTFTFLFTLKAYQTLAHP
jgi:hypothetical protein